MGGPSGRSVCEPMMYLSPFVGVIVLLPKTIGGGAGLLLSVRVSEETGSNFTVLLPAGVGAAEPDGNASVEDTVFVL